MKDVLFWTFWAIFAATAIVTLLGLVERVRIRPEFLRKLFYVLILEVVGAVVILFNQTWLTPSEPSWTRLASFKTVNSFYHDIQTRDFSAAYDQLSPSSPLREKLSRDLFVEGYANTGSVRLLAVLPHFITDNNTHEYLVYYLDEVTTQIIPELKDVHRMRVRDIPALQENVTKLKERLRLAGFADSTIDELTFEQLLAQNGGDKILLLLKRDTGQSAEALFPEKALRKFVSGYLVTVIRVGDEWLIRSIIPVQNAVQR